MVERRATRGKQSAGLLLYRRRGAGCEVLLVHPGGPFWVKKDLGAWSVPKGELAAGEDALEAARREFFEETGVTAAGPFHELGEVKQASGKRVLAWAAAGDCDAAQCKSNTFELQWPPRSGRVIVVPEVDKADWFSLEAAREKLLEAQRPFLDRLRALLGIS